jgi:hypothetical protein
MYRPRGELLGSPARGILSWFECAKELLCPFLFRHLHTLRDTTLVCSGHGSLSRLLANK